MPTGFTPDILRQQFNVARPRINGEIRCPRTNKLINSIHPNPMLD